MEEVLNIIRDETLTYQQQLLALARLAENMDDTLQRSRSIFRVSAKAFSAIWAKVWRPTVRAISVRIISS